MYATIPRFSRIHSTIAKPQISPSCSAIQLYEANGYRIEGRPEDYYPLGRAALICLKALGTEPAS